MNRLDIYIYRLLTELGFPCPPSSFPPPYTSSSAPHISITAGSVGRSIHECQRRIPRRRNPEDLHVIMPGGNAGMKKELQGTIAGSFLGWEEGRIGKAGRTQPTGNGKKNVRAQHLFFSIGF